MSFDLFSLKKQNSIRNIIYLAALFIGTTSKSSVRDYSSNIDKLSNY